MTPAIAVPSRSPKARKSLGQHFLLDSNICRKIVRLAQLPAEALVIEVGPGPGGLTRALLDAGVRVIAIEKDERFAVALDELEQAANGRLQVVRADALKVDAAGLVGGHGAHVVANLPYNIGTVLLVGWLDGPFRPLSMTLMFQREVAQRLVARAGEEAYGRLTVLAQTLARADIVMKLPAAAFTPRPKVDSAVVRLAPRSDRPCDTLVAALQEITRHAFGQRRKMLRSSLRALGGEALCERAGVPAQMRAEDVDLEGYLALASARIAAPGLARLR
jgi:16S rRNA (adenine1518-N6/adenine1519-N6)-dimethyltransferase